MFEPDYKYRATKAAEDVSKLESEFKKFKRAVLEFLDAEEIQIEKDSDWGKCFVPKIIKKGLIK